MVEVRIKPKEPREILSKKTKRRMTKALIESINEHLLAKKDIKYLFYSLYKAYPNGELSELWIKDLIKSDPQRKALLEGAFLVREKKTFGPTDEEYFVYGLGPNGLNLISMWNVERMTKWVVALAITTIILAAISIFLTLAH